MTATVAQPCTCQNCQKPFTYLRVAGRAGRRPSYCSPECKAEGSRRLKQKAAKGRILLRQATKPKAETPKPVEPAKPPAPKHGGQATVEKTATCQVCGFDFTFYARHWDSSPRKYCGTKCRSTGIKVAHEARLNSLGANGARDDAIYHLAREVTMLRVAVEIASRRLGMGIYGSQCNLDTIHDARREAIDELTRVVEAHDILASTRGKLDLPDFRVDVAKVIDLTERRDMVETMAS